MNAPKSVPNFTDLSPIDTGTSSKLFRATHIGTNKQVVLKRYSTTEITKRESDYVLREMNIHKSVGHPFIASYYGAMKTDDEFILILEDVSGQSLLSKINTAGCLYEFEVQKIFSQLVCAVSYLHNEVKISHRDLKLENIMLDLDGNIKIIDFGVSNKNDGLMNTQCGSFPYIAPELLRGESYSNKVDVWSMAVILFTLFTGEFPFEAPNITQCTHKILNEEPPYPTHISLDALDLLTKMLDKNPDNRINIDDVALHPWLSADQYNVNIINSSIKKAGLMQVGPHIAIDNSVLEICRKKGVNTNTLASQLQTLQDTNLTIVYRILKTEKNEVTFNSLYSSLVADSTPFASPPMFVPAPLPQHRNRSISNSPVPFINYPDSYPVASIVVPNNSARGTGLPKLSKHPSGITNQGSNITIGSSPIVSKISFQRNLKIRSSKPNIRPSSLPTSSNPNVPLDNIF